MKKQFKTYLLLMGCLGWAFIGLAQNPEATNLNKFRQLYQELPTPNVYRNAAGAPGYKYWQQQADYKIAVRLDEKEHRIYGEETITYHNQSPDPLSYLWLQLDQNVRAKNSDTYKVQQEEIDEEMRTGTIKNFVEREFDGGFKIDWVNDDTGKPLPHTIVKTMMRVDLPTVLQPGKKFTFQIKWNYLVNDRAKLGGRSGFEWFAEEENAIYTIAQFFPRMAVYVDNEGWQHKQFLGRGEFTLTFGDYEVEITVPADHYVSATGVLQNANEVLSEKERNRYAEAQKAFDTPVMIVTEEEARKNEKEKVAESKTWKFKAENVRDFAFASSRKFIWDAMAVKQSDGSVVMAMSMYPKEGNPLWEQYSTKVVAHTLKWYSHYTFDYPYPVAWSIHTDRIGMEYPMICFNGGRPEADGTYTSRTKYGMISVIIHEVGHNYFPMIVNSDERQWTWMDEGLNSFVQILAEQQWERDYPGRRGEPSNIVSYMAGDKSRIAPIMTNSESIFQFGNNAYGKPATALNILRETILGRELFDYAFKEYSRRWMFKHPSPADFFRTMEDASGVDLDWFWRGWFYTNDHVDIAVKDVRVFSLNTQNPVVEKGLQKEQQQAAPKSIMSIRNRESIAQTQDEKDPSLRDFYTEYDPLEVDAIDQKDYEKYLAQLDPEEKELLDAGYKFYEIHFELIGGLVMPIIVELQYTDGTNEVHYIPAEIWRFGDTEVSKVFASKKELSQVVLDPYLETADIDTENNYFPPKPQMSRFELYKSNRGSRENPMQRAKRAEEMENN